MIIFGYGGGDSAKSPEGVGPLAIVIDIDVMGLLLCFLLGRELHYLVVLRLGLALFVVVSNILFVAPFV